MAMTTDTTHNQLIRNHNKLSSSHSRGRVGDDVSVGCGVGNGNGAVGNVGKDEGAALGKGEGNVVVMSSKTPPLRVFGQEEREESVTARFDSFESGKSGLMRSSFDAKLLIMLLFHPERQAHAPMLFLQHAVSTALLHVLRPTSWPVLCPLSSAQTVIHSDIQNCTIPTHVPFVSGRRRT